MSLWDRYFAPGDLRRQQQQQQSPPPPPPPSLSPTHQPVTTRTASTSTLPLRNDQTPGPVVLKTPPPTHSTLPPSTLPPTPHQQHPSLQEPRLSPSDRSRRQNALLYGGLAFTILSVFVTRRALTRKNAQMRAQAEAAAAALAANPKLPASAIAESTKVDGTLEAVQALGYATLNVFSTAMLAVGFGMVYFDVADLEDLRAAVRGGAGYAGLDDEASEREIVGAVQGWVDEVRGRKGGVGADVGVERDVERERMEMRREIEGEVRRRLEDELRRVSGSGR